MTTLYGPDHHVVYYIHKQLDHLSQLGGPFSARHTLTCGQIADIIESAFWASLRQNEGRRTRARLSVERLDSPTFPTALKTDVSYTEEAIAKLAQAVPRTGCIVVGYSESSLWIRGIRERAPSLMNSLAIDIIEPGMLRVDIGAFQPFAVLMGRDSHIISSSRISLAGFLQRVLHPHPDETAFPELWRHCMFFGSLARALLAQGHGAIVLVVPSDNDRWRVSLDPFPYQFVSPVTMVGDHIRQRLIDEGTFNTLMTRMSKEDVPPDVRDMAIAMFANRFSEKDDDPHTIACLGGVDGAIVITRDLNLLGFGATIAAKVDSPFISFFRPVGDDESQECQPEPLDSLSGTRHQSAARFIAANKDCVALVISQDRRLSVMHWWAPDNVVAVFRNAEWWA